MQPEVGSIAASSRAPGAAGTPFLWFVGVLRDRLGEQEEGVLAPALVGRAQRFCNTSQKYDSISKLRSDR